MEAGFITIILNALLVIFILLGFLWGVGRGLKKSALRLGFFAGAIVLAFIFTGSISNLLLDLRFQIDGTLTTVKDYIVNIVASEQTIAELYNASPSLQEFVSQMPVMILNVFVFVLLLYIFKFLTWIAYSITVNIMESRRRPLGKFGETVYTVKDGQPVVLTKVVEKKYRLLGGLISGVQALILLFLTLIPISGFVSIVNTLSNQTVEAQTFTVEQEPEYTQFATLIRDKVGPEILGYFDAYSQSITVKVTGAGNINLAVFDALTATQVGGERIVLRNELYSLAQIYENFSFLIEMDLDNFDVESLDFNNLKSGINSLFNSGIFKALALDFLQYYLDNIDEDAFENTGYDTEILRLLEAIDNSLENISESNNKNELIKQDLLAAVNLMQILVESEFYDLISQSEINEDAIFELLRQDNYKLTQDILDNLFISATFKEALAECLNILLEYAEDGLYLLVNSQQEISQGTANEVTLDRVSSATLNYVTLKTDMLNIIKNLGEIYWSEKNLDLELPIQEILAEVDSELVLTKSGIVLNILKNSTMVKDTVGGNNIFEQVLTLFNNSQYGEFANFNSLKSINWENETQNLIELFDYYLTLSETEIVFEGFDYETLTDNLNLLFDSDLFKSIRVDAINLALQNYELSSNLEFLSNFIYAHLNDKFNYVYQTKSEILSLLNAFEILGQSELIDLIINNNLSDLSPVFEFLKLQNADIDDANLNVLIDNLLASDTFKIVFVKLFNNAFLSQIENSSENLGRVDKDLNWQGWNEFKPQVKSVLSEMIEIAQNAGIKNLNQLNNFDFSDLINENFAETAKSIGRILDILATTDLLNYQSDETQYSIYDNLLEKYLEDILTIDMAKTDKYVSGFWLNEMQVLSDAISKASLIEIDLEGTSLLEALISGQDLPDVFETVQKSEHFDTILNAILDSKLLKEQAIQILNMINKSIINLIDELYDEDAIGLEFDIASNKQSIIDVIDAILNADIESFDDIIDDFESHKESVVDLLEALQADYNNEGAFKEAYEILADFLTADDSEFEYAPYIAGIIANEDVGDDISEFDWAEIFDILQDLLES